MQSNETTSQPPTVELIDDAHQAWPAVLNHIEKLGQQQRLYVSTGGWLSARQSLLAAFVDGRVVGHLMFHVEPKPSAVAAILGPGGHPSRVAAYLDGCGVEPGYGCDVSKSLWSAAVNRAAEIDCDPEPIKAASDKGC